MVECQSRMERLEQDCEYLLATVTAKSLSRVMYTGEARRLRAKFPELSIYQKGSVYSCKGIKHHCPDNQYVYLISKTP